MKNINSSLKNIYLSNELFFNTYLNRKIISKSKEHFNIKKNNNAFKDKKFKEFKKKNINKSSNVYSDYIKSL